MDKRDRCLGATTRIAGLLLLLLMPGCLAAGPPPAVDDLAWMSGSWVTERDGKRLEEHWTRPAGGMMVGMHRDVLGPERVMFEFMRIQAGPDGIDLLASPGGKPPTAFRLVKSGARSVTFANPEHDFPQRLLYWIDEESRLCARAEAGDPGEERGSTWCWKRVTGDE